MTELSTEEAWRRAVLVGLKGAPFEKLAAKSAEGIVIEPLYTPRDVAGLSVRGEPGAMPFVRGSRPAGSGPWQVAARVTAGEPVEHAREEVESGADGIWLMMSAPPASAKASELAGALGAGAAVFCAAGAHAPAAYDALTRAGIGRAHALFHPAGAPAFADAARLVEKAERESPGCRALSIDATLVHEAGGSAALEIGYALASLAEMMRELEPLGITPARTLASTAMIVTAGPLHLEAVAKLRALRLGYAKLAAAIGVTDPPAPYVIGQVSRRAQSRADAPANFLRGTLEVFALAVGGADVIVPRPFDELLATHSDLGRRVALTTQLILRDESHLADVADPAGGAYFVEALTEAFARSGWDELRAIEKEGGVAASIASGAFTARVARAGQALLTDARKRKQLIVGTSDFAATGEKLPAAEVLPDGGPFAPVRSAAVYEAVRERATALKSPNAVLVRLGGGEVRAREEFAQRFFEVGGFTVRAVEGTDAPGFTGAYPGAVFVLVGTDERYAEVAVSFTRALRAAGASAVVLAGKPGALDADLRAAGLTASAYVGCDVPQVLDDALTALGAEGAE